MAIELNLKKSGTSTWGFRLTGGSECEVPLTVIQVEENSIADKGGLQVNDVVVRVNQESTAGLTHGQVHELLVASGNSLDLAVRRGEILDLGPYMRFEDANEEIAGILRHEEKKVHFEESAEAPSDISTQSESLVLQVVKEAEAAAKDIKNRKWSTFLQKPKNAKPKKAKSAETADKVKPYRVIIKKQPKRKPGEKYQPSVVEVVSETPSEKPEISQEIEIESKSEDVSLVETEPEPESEEVEELTREPHEEPETVDETSTTEDMLEEQVLQKKRDSETQRILEEKLTEVQRQLEALARLPSTIQSTIDSMTQQIAAIVGAKDVTEDLQAEEVEDIEDDDNTQAESIRDISVSENDDDAFQNITEEESWISTEEAATVQDKPEEVIDEEVEAEVALTEEEQEQRQMELDQLEKQQKGLKSDEQPQRRPLRPVQRPIILPGGRRWSQPEDIIPATRQSKMSDEKIADTIEGFTEVIIGKTKGINFLKYQPPPKNLDYLQRSDVYKLVHDLEPPVRGISSRACKILAETDYYQGESSA